MAMKATVVCALRASPLWVEDRWGHFQVFFKEQQYRIKIQANSLRYEKKTDTEWEAKTHDYFKNVTVSDGRLRVKGYSIPLDHFPA